MSRLPLTGNTSKSLRDALTNEITEKRVSAMKERYNREMENANSSLPPEQRVSPSFNEDAVKREVKKDTEIFVEEVLKFLSERLVIDKDNALQQTAPPPHFKLQA